MPFAQTNSDFGMRAQREAAPPGWMLNGEFAFSVEDQLLSVLRQRSRGLRLPQQLHERSRRGRGVRASSWLRDIAELFLVPPETHC